MIRNLLDFARELWGAFIRWACPGCTDEGRWEASQW